ncbi:MAG: cytochrome c biogenesis protein CcsA, partial [Candidatus Hydrogenedentes bacterium]|nr:cytochrome c biogenesis protein CcsA [Candidatus Hydrogenedentota bacterium]
LVQPIEWMADCLFYPERAKLAKSFRMDNSDVAVALGMTFERKRDRYSYAELEPARDKLMQLAREYSGIPQEQRNAVQSQLINLAQNLLEFENLCDYLSFARAGVAIPQDSPISGLFPGEPRPRLSLVLAKAAQIKELIGKDPSQNKSTHEYLQALYESVSGATLRLFPPVEPAETEWLTPESITQQAFGPAQVSPESLNLLGLLEDAALNPADPAKIAAFHSAVTVQTAGRADCAKIPLEVTFHRLKLFYYSLVVFVLGFLAVTVSWLAPRSRVVYASGIVSVLVAAILLAAGITLRCIIRGRPPVTTLYETILFATLVAVGVAVFMELANRRSIMLALAAVLGTLGMFLANKYEIREGADTMPSMVAVLDTNFWLATHVTTITMGYGAGFLASAIAHIYIAGRALRLKAKDAAFYRQLARMTYGVLCFSLLFTIVGTVLGGIWANESWGRFWGWDPKENGALMIVLWQLAILHARLGGYIKDFGIVLASVFTGVVVAFSWFGVNLLGVGLHSYGFTSGTYKALLGFYAIEAVVLLVGAAVWSWEDKKRALNSQKECR